MSNTNPKLRLLAKNKNKLDRILVNSRRLKSIFTALLRDNLPDTASARFKEVRKKQISECRALVTRHEKFVSSEKTQKSINDMDTDLLNFLKPFAKLGL